MHEWQTARLMLIALVVRVSISTIHGRDLVVMWIQAWLPNIAWDVINISRQAALVNIWTIWTAKSETQKSSDTVS